MEHPRLANLRLKFEGTTWNDTFKLVRRCMEKSHHKSKPSEPMVRALKRLHEVMNEGRQSMMCRLKMIAIQQGVNFHMSSSTCYLTADLLYVEVSCLPSGVVTVVNVAPYGKPPTPSNSLLQLLRSENFTGFSVKLGNLFDYYRIPGNNALQLALLSSLKFLAMDLEQVSCVWGVPQSQFQREMISYGKVGNIINKTDCPLSIEFFVPPVGIWKTSESNQEPVVQVARVTIGASREIHRLQMASALQRPPQLDLLGCPVFLPMSDVPHEMVPACFQLKLQPPLPMMQCFMEMLSRITGIAMPASNLQRAPFPKLLTGSLSSKNHWKTLADQEVIFTVPLPDGVVHNYVFPNAWDVPNWTGTMVDVIPFTHPAHVVDLLDVLRHQCAFNVLLKSCALQTASEGLECDLHFEVLPECDASFSVTFHRPNTDSLAVVGVKVCGPFHVRCILYGAGTSKSGIDMYISTIASRSMSIPVTMRLLYRKLEELTSAPLYPSCPVATEAENDHWAPWGTALTNTSRGPAASSRGAAVPTHGSAVSGSGPIAPAAGGEELPEINAHLLSALTHAFF